MESGWLFNIYICISSVKEILAILMEIYCCKCLILKQKRWENKS